jgi:hypothetical protein
MTYGSEDKIEISIANPQGINSSILVLDLKVVTKTGPMKGTPKHFNFELSDSNAKSYSQVTIRYSEEASITLNIEIFG